MHNSRPRLRDGLPARGIKTHIFELGLHAVDDPVIWERARTDQAVIISKDEDFVDRWLLSNQLLRWCGFERGIARIGHCLRGLSPCGLMP
jgi:Domain of unknown function (DUF5615)